MYAYLIGPVSVLKNWDYRCGENSIATTLAIEWGQKILPSINRTNVLDDEENDIAGRFVVEPILANINGSDILVADE